MSRQKLEVADIFRAYGPAWRRANAGHVSLTQLKVMAAIEACRTEALGGHVAACTKCGHNHIAYNSCKNRHCPKCQAPAARDWLARAEDLLPVEYFHVVFALRAERPAGGARPMSQRSALCLERKRANKMIRQALRRSRSL
ncbi:IS91 family insertion sequence transposase domain-containing protein (plasmid) [Sinorhizobium fredii]|uniref:IS91 family insertion sequence transposase domain-containing protein n=1 Tax=Rhizobium fredii TaxID=380 RepID=A0A2L0HDV4_RHIFR|nr:IS91 family insertion sequence transposase domain-containing protein [Sinorhizobium fredii]